MKSKHENWPFESKPRLKNKKDWQQRVSLDKKMKNEKDWPFESKPRLKNKKDWPIESKSR